jgi:hypothetical protein
MGQGDFRIWPPLLIIPMVLQVILRMVKGVSLFISVSWLLTPRLSPSSDHAVIDKTGTLDGSTVSRDPGKAHADDKDAKGQESTTDKPNLEAIQSKNSKKAAVSKMLTDRVKPLKIKIFAFGGGSSSGEDVIDHTGSAPRPVASIVFKLVPPSSSWSSVSLRELRQKVEEA